jgi:sterol desaturase/sphingolipid hydroxylase (fatty acid hydroxylase superfamily)
MKQWTHHAWVLFYSISSLVVHQVLLEMTGYRIPSRWVIGAYYFTAFQVILTQEVHILRRFAHTYGFLDGDKHERDGVPDVGVSRAVASLLKTLGSRTAVTILLTYNPSETPFDAMGNLSWWAWLFVKIAAYGVVLDFWFYWYHRVMHEVPFLWKFHRKHHLIKHPVPLLTAYADDEQEFFDMVGVPLMTYYTLYVLGCRLGFYDWWVCHLFIAYTEVWGHSGLRLYMVPPSTIDWLLLFFDLDLTIEDHDLHHRKGWRKSHNYCKQTRLWDYIFGTTTGRIEVAKDNIDLGHEVRMPLF